MIILKHLTTQQFRALREIDLHFPQRGSILIQGPNEAGKSALFESIYFALYGTPVDSWSVNHGRRSADDLILYGASQATTTLTLSVGATELTINRTIERGKAQQVTLHVRKLGLPEEPPITDPVAANERIIDELGHMDGEALRNSCFIEQKGLHRLEDLPGSEREATIRKLLGLEKLMRLTEQFKLTPNDEQMLVDSAERLKLAEIQANIPELSQQLGQLEVALDAVTVSEDLAEISQQEAEIAEQELSLEQLRAKRSQLKARQIRIQHLRKADATLAGIIAAYDDIAESHRELPELDRQIAELDRREREELPPLEQRVNDLADLTRSFGTLERMSNDLLTSVSTIKELEQELIQHQQLQRDSNELDQQMIEAHLRVDQARQTLNELEERRRAGRPQLEARLQRLQGLSERLVMLHQAEEAYTQRVMQQGLIEENTTLLAKVRKELKETEQELALVEAEARQDQQQAEAEEKHWRQLSINRQLEEWIRLKGLAEIREGLEEAERHVIDAHRHQEQLTVAALDARRAANRWLITAISSGILGMLLGAVALFIASQQAIPAAILGMIALMLFAGAAYSYYTYSKEHNQEQIANQQMQNAISQMGMMVAAREAAMRMGGGIGGGDAGRERIEGTPIQGQVPALPEGKGSKRGTPLLPLPAGNTASEASGPNDLGQVEHEIRSLGGTVPRSREEAQHLLQQTQQDRSESLADIQQRMTEKRDVALASRNRVNVTMEAVAALRKERQRLEDQRKNEGWDDFDAKLRSDRIAIEDRQNEIATLAGQEGLPIPSFDASNTQTLATNAEFEIAIADAIKATEREIASLDGKLDLVSDLAAQVKIQQDALDILLSRQRGITVRRERFQALSPMQQIERAREQQIVLRSALQNLQDSLRQRVKPLGVSFGQAAISQAETVARKQLEALQITLGRRLEQQGRRANYLAILKDRQDALADHYQQLAKFSGTLGSWIVPPNPFAEALAALRQRCQQEIEEANESNILQELEKLRIQENASNAKIRLCRQEIEEVHERIAAMLVQRSRPATRGYNFTDIVAVWPLVGEYTSQDRSRLEEQRETLEKQLQELEQQELALSTQLHTGGNKLDLAQARLRLEQQERSYQTRKRGNLLITSVNERLLRKMLPRTEYFMQQILPLLTSGRYHDVRLSTESEDVGASLLLPHPTRTQPAGNAAAQETGTPAISGGPFQLRVWDTAAGEYVYKSALSGGAADQLSFALRLAFAIAVLPHELAAAPGFMLLDEPLSSFDRGRTQALVDVVTGEMLGQHFEQVLFISHSSAFDPSMFPYHLYMENGLIVESNLPAAPAAEAQFIVPTVGTIAVDNNEYQGDELVDAPATPIAVAFGE